MSSTKKKKNTYEWRECEICGCVLNSRNFQDHDIHWGQRFPEIKAKILNELAARTSRNQGFFIDKRFFTPIIDRSKEMVAKIVKLGKYIDRIVLLHPYILQHLNLKTSDEVVLCNSSNNRIISHVWPSIYVRVGAIALNPNIYKTFPIKSKDWIMLEPYTAPKLSAASIYLKPLKNYLIDDMAEFTSILRTYHYENYFTEGNKLVINYMGLDYKFLVVKIIQEVSKNESSFLLDSIDVQNFTFNEGQSFDVSLLSESVRNLSICDKSDTFTFNLSQNFNGSQLNESLQNMSIWDQSEMNSTCDFDTQNETSFPVGDADSETDILPKFFCVTSKTEIIICSENSTSPKNHPETKLSFDSIGGLKNEKQKLQNLLKIKQNLDVVHVNITGILLYGLQGTGKTLLAKVSAEIQQYYFITVNPSYIFGRQGQACKYLEEVFCKAKQKSPSIIFLNNFDLLSSKHNKLIKNDVELLNVKRFLITLMDDLRMSKEKVVVVAETNKIEEIDSDFRSQGRFDEEIKFSVPSEDERQEILTVMMKNVHHKLSKQDFCTVAKETHAFVGSDLEMLCSRAKQNVVIRTANSSIDQVLTLDDFKFARKKISPSGMRGLELKVPEVFWDDIAIKEETRNILEQIIVWPIKYPHLFKDSNAMFNRNALLYGPPGCSKTLIAKTYATESGLNFIAVKSSELISKYFGDSEHAINNLFERARLTAPSIIFFDEFDGIAMKNVNSAMEIDTASMKIRSQLAIEFDKSKPSHNVAILAATNRPDLIDDAFLSASRLGTKIYIPLPDKSIRRQIFKITFRKTPIADDVNVEELVSRTDKFSGAEIVQLCHNAARIALREYGDDLDCVKMTHFEQALQAVKPRISDALIKHNELYFQTTKNKNYLAYM